MIYLVMEDSLAVGIYFPKDVQNVENEMKIS